MVNRFILLICFVSLHGCIAQKSPNLVQDKLETSVEETLNYYLYFPEDYIENHQKKFPLLLFLHGGGESGESLELMNKNGPPKLIKDGKKFPFLILAPQNPYKKKWWNTRAIVQLLDSVIADNRIDKKRIYLTGLSRGGGAAWEMAVQYPDKFAAMAVVCGMTPLPYANWINKKMPIWVFHGDQDEVIPISESIDMVNKLENMGYDIKFTEYKGVGHNSWVRAYDTEELYTWFMMQEQE